MKNLSIYKYKTCRKYGFNLWLSKKINKKCENYLKRKKKYKNNRYLSSKLRKKFYYDLEFRRILSYLYEGLSLKYIKNILKLAKRFKKKGLNSQQMLNKNNNNLPYLYKKSLNEYFATTLFLHLEQRLDVTLYRMNLCTSIREARQLIIHKQIFVNNNSILSPTYILKVGDIITVREYILEKLRKRMYQAFLENSFQVYMINHIACCFITFSFIYISPPSQKFFTNRCLFPSLLGKLYYKPQQIDGLKEKIKKLEEEKKIREAHEARKRKQQFNQERWDNRHSKEGKLLWGRRR